MNRSWAYKVNIPEGKSGPWEVKRFTVSEEEAEMSRLRSMFNGGRYVPAGEYTSLTRDGYLVMADTPDEIRDHREPIRRAVGDCLVNGLGLGMVVQGMFEIGNAQTVTVIENSLDVISLVGSVLKARYPGRLIIHHQDAFDWKRPKDMRYNVVWHDIWDDICADNLPEMARLHRKYGHWCDWQGSWARSLCEKKRRESRRYHGVIM